MFLVVSVVGRNACSDDTFWVGGITLDSMIGPITVRAAPMMAPIIIPENPTTIDSFISLDCLSRSSLFSSFCSFISRLCHSFSARMYGSSWWWCLACIVASSASVLVFISSIIIYLSAANAKLSRSQGNKDFQFCTAAPAVCLK